MVCELERRALQLSSSMIESYSKRYEKEALKLSATIGALQLLSSTGKGVESDSAVLTEIFGEVESKESTN